MGTPGIILKIQIHVRQDRTQGRADISVKKEEKE